MERIMPMPNTPETGGISFETLPAIIQQNQGLTSRAIAALQNVILPTELSALDVLTGDNIEAQVNDLRSRAKQAVEANKERRMPYTRKMDEVKALFTAAEKQIEEAAKPLHDWVAKWAAEKDRRLKAAQEEQQRKLQIENARVDFALRIQQDMDRVYCGYLGHYLREISKDFYKQKNEAELNAFILTITPQTYALPVIQIQPIAPPALPAEELNEIYHKTYNETIPLLHKDYAEKLAAEADRLKSLIPGRVAELERIASDERAAAEAAQRIEEEQRKLAEQLAAEAAQREQAAEAKANTEKLSAAFAEAAIAPAVEQSKGTVKKLKYAPKTHKEMLPIIQWWITNHMPLITIDEARKKFSFMFTAANKELNKGTVIEGCPTEEDFTVRTSRR